MQNSGLMYKMHQLSASANDLIPLLSAHTKERIRRSSPENTRLFDHHQRLVYSRSKCLRSFKLAGGDNEPIKSEIAAIDGVVVNVIGYSGDIVAVSRDFKRNPFRYGRDNERCAGRAAQGRCAHAHAGSDCGGV